MSVQFILVILICHQSSLLLSGLPHLMKQGLHATVETEHTSFCLAEGAQPGVLGSVGQILPPTHQVDLGTASLWKLWQF